LIVRYGILFTERSLEIVLSRLQTIIGNLGNSRQSAAGIRGHCVFGSTRPAASSPHQPDLDDVRTLGVDGPIEKTRG
jgi:hypothetical protein